MILAEANAAHERKVNISRMKTKMLKAREARRKLIEERKTGKQRRLRQGRRKSRAKVGTLEVEEEMALDLLNDLKVSTPKTDEEEQLSSTDNQALFGRLLTLR